MHGKVNKNTVFRTLRMYLIAKCLLMWHASIYQNSSKYGNIISEENVGHSFRVSMLYQENEIKIQTQNKVKTSRQSDLVHSNANILWINFNQLC